MTADQMRRLVRDSRTAQGLADSVTDPRFLVDLAGTVAEAGGDRDDS